MAHVADAAFAGAYRRSVFMLCCYNAMHEASLWLGVSIGYIKIEMEVENVLTPIVW